MKEEILEKIKTIAADEDCTVIDLNIKGSRSGGLIQVFIHREGGVTLDDCSIISRKVSRYLDEKDAEIPFSTYRLEVSSPGLDRPLQTTSDFIRNVGREIVIKYRNEGRTLSAQGKILNLDDNEITIEGRKGVSKINRDEIIQATVTVSWQDKEDGIQ